MAECEVCGEQVETPVECEYCGEAFCFEHRLPDEHDCPSYVAGPGEPTEDAARIGTLPPGHTHAPQDHGGQGKQGAPSTGRGDDRFRRGEDSGNETKLYETIPGQNDDPGHARELPVKLEPILVVFLLLLILAALHFGNVI